MSSNHASHHSVAWEVELLDSKTRLLNYETAAGLLGISRALLRRWVMHKRIPHLRLGPRTVRFELVKLHEWMRQCEVDVVDTVGGSRGR